MNESVHALSRLQAGSRDWLYTELPVALLGDTSAHGIQNPAPAPPHSHTGSPSGTDFNRALLCMETPNTDTAASAAEVHTKLSPNFICIKQCGRLTGEKKVGTTNSIHTVKMELSAEAGGLQTWPQKGSNHTFCWNVWCR